MLYKIERFFHWLTFNNWGFPWHILLCFIAMGYGKLIWPAWYVAPGIFIIGLIYEVWQMRKVKEQIHGYDPQADMVQDLTANMIGITLGILI